MKSFGEGCFCCPVHPPKPRLRARARQATLSRETGCYDVVVVSCNECYVVVCTYKLTRLWEITPGKDDIFIAAVEANSAPPKFAVLQSKTREFRAPRRSSLERRRAIFPRCSG